MKFNRTIAGGCLTNDYAERMLMKVGEKKLDAYTLNTNNQHITNDNDFKINIS